MTDTQNANLAETLAAEMKQPISMLGQDEWLQRAALPPGWSMIEKDDIKLSAVPRRKTACVRLADADGFIDYMRRHGSLTNSTVWCAANYQTGDIEFTGIINDHGETEDEAAWRDHLVKFSPVFSEEWKRWTSRTAKPFTQVEFAEFIENNLKDIAGVENSPTGAQMLEMAVTFEANQDMRFKSAIRLQNGGVQMSFSQNDDAQTLQKMQVFDRFSLGLPVFWNADAYQLDARLRYRTRDGKLTFWFELIRHDKVLEAATQTLITLIREKTGNPFFFGNPFFN